MKLALIIILDFIAGTALLIYGVQLLSNGLEKAGPRLIHKILSALTGNLICSFLTGIAVTALVQSSTAVTLLTVSFVNSGIMQLKQAVGIIYGANIGTTVTAQLMSFNPKHIALPMAATGFAWYLLAKKQRTRHLAKALAGLGLMFLGIGILSSGAPLVKSSPAINNVFVKYGNNPVLGVFIGFVTTMLVHSSAATVGLTIVLFNAGLISFDAAIGLTMGDNIGTCMTAQLASLNTSTAAKRTAWAHTLYNLIGVLLVMVFFRPFADFTVRFTEFAGQSSERLVANAHTLFNVLSAVIFMPFTGAYIKFIEWLVPEGPGKTGVH